MTKVLLFNAQTEPPALCKLLSLLSKIPIMNSLLSGGAIKGVELFDRIDQLVDDFAETYKLNLQQKEVVRNIGRFLRTMKIKLFSFMIFLVLDKSPVDASRCIFGSYSFRI
jgi:hypothetical protein